MKTQVGRWGNSLALRIPKGLAEEAGIKEGAGVELSLDQGRLLITPMGGEYSLGELVKDINSKNRHEETSWGGLVGGEAW